MSSFTPAGSGGQPSTPVVVDGLTVITPTIANVPMALASTEYSYVLPANTRRFLILLRTPSTAKMKLAYASGDSGTLYVTVNPGCHYGEGEILSPALTLYFQATLSGQVAEIVSWSSP